MGKKTKKISDEVLEKWYKDDWNLLHERNSSKVDKLYQLYEKDKYVARVIYMNDTSDYEQFRTILFTTKEGEFTLVLFRKRYGISKNNVIYNHQKRMVEVLYKKGKFYLINNTGRGSSGIKTLTLDSLANACANVEARSGFLYKNVINILIHRFPWIEFIEENKVLRNIAFNTIVSKKLFNLKKALTHEYKTTHPVAKMLHAKKHGGGNNGRGRSLIEVLPVYIPYIINIESLQGTWFDGGVDIFHDALKMAKTLDKKVNASWTPRRLKEEHDKWASILSDIVFIDGNRDMNIGQVFKDFAEHSGYQLITTTRDMAYEGKRQNHCVASYVNTVESGTSAIFRTTDFTIEMGTTYMYDKDGRNGKQGVTIKQVRGYKNCSPTEAVTDKLKNGILAFNKTLQKDFDFPDKELILGTAFDPFDVMDVAVAVPADDDGLPF